MSLNASRPLDKLEPYQVALAPFTSLDLRSHLPFTLAFKPNWIEGSLSISSLSSDSPFPHPSLSVPRSLSCALSPSEIPSVDLIQSAPGVMLVFQSSELPILVGNVALAVWEARYTFGVCMNMKCVCVSLFLPAVCVALACTLSCV